VSPSTVAPLNETSATSRASGASSSRASGASVATNASMVAMSGWIMPAPLAMPVTVTGAPSMSTRRDAALCTVSVVMMPRAAAIQPSARAAARAAGSAATSRLIGSGSMITPVENGSTSAGAQSSSCATATHVACAAVAPDSPVPVELYPSLAFDNLFENRGSLRNLSILDRVKESAETMGRQVSGADKNKLDEYLTSVREVEKRVEGMRKNKDAAEDKAKLKNTAAFTMERPANGLPEDLRDHARLMCDIIAIAFQTDKTRVASLIISRDLSALYYPWLGVAQGHHAASHNNNSDGYEAISRWHVDQFRYLAAKLDSMPEGDGTVLDNSCLMFLSSLFVGRTHDNSRLPVVLAGGLGGSLKTGRSLNYLGEPAENRKMCSLYLSLMDRMGVQLDHFGDADSRLARL